MSSSFLFHCQTDAKKALSSIQELVRSDLTTPLSLRDLLGRSQAKLLESIGFIDTEPVLRIRPLLVSLAARAAGAGSVDRELQHAVELLHLVLVVRDVTLGRSGGLRRRMAQLVMRRSFDWLGAASQVTLRALELARHTSHPAILGETVDTLREFSDGQALSQQLRERSLVPNQSDWIDYADTHTGALYAFCCRTGGHLGHAPATALSALGRYGRHMGRLWTIASDAHHLTGAHAGSYLLRKAKTGQPILQVVLATETHLALGDAWSQLFHHSCTKTAHQVANQVMGAPSASRVKRAVAQEAWSAQQALRGLPDNRYRVALHHLASQLAQVA